MSSGSGKKIVQTRRNNHWNATCTKPTTLRAAPKRKSPDGGQPGYDVVDASPTHVYTWWDVCVTLFSMASYIVDVGTDVSLAVLYYQQKRLTYFSWTVVFIVLPSLVISVFSLRWYVLDHKSKKDLQLDYDSLDARLNRVPLWKWIVRFLCITLQIAPLLRYTDALWYGWKSRRLKEEHHHDERKFFYQLMLYEDADSTLLRLFEAFMEAAPQLVLQLYIMVNYGIDGEKEKNYFLVTFQTGSVCMSLVSLAWSLVSYHKSLRLSRHNKKNMTYLGMILCFCWRICVLLPRVLAFALFATHYTLLLLAVVGFHWAAMTLWIIIESFTVDPSQPNFCKSRSEQILFDAIIGIVWIFCCFNIREGHTRKRYIIYYSIAYIENATLITIWYYFTDKKDQWFHLPSLIGVQVVFFLGIFFMLLYYRYSHPEGISVCLPHSYWRCRGQCSCDKCKEILYELGQGSSETGSDASRNSKEFIQKTSSV